MHCATAQPYATVAKYSDVWLAQINSQTLDNFLLQMETGYSKYSNPYHNTIHAADVTQTTHHVISRSGLSVGIYGCHYFARERTYAQSKPSGLSRPTALGACAHLPFP